MHQLLTKPVFASYLNGVGEKSFKFPSDWEINIDNGLRISLNLRLYSSIRSYQTLNYLVDNISFASLDCAPSKIPQKQKFQ